MNALLVTYKNWRQVTRTRTIIPTGEMRFGSTEWHPEPQWLIKATDTEDGTIKEFALKDCNFLNHTTNP